MNSDEQPSGPRRKPARRNTKARPVTASYLRNAALNYLKQRAASRAMVRQTLVRRAKSRLQVKVLEPETLAHIERVIEALVADGLLNDATFAASRKVSLAHKGLPARQIAQRLRLKGIDKETIAATVADGIDDLAQARRFAERRRLGPWSRKPESPEQRRRDLAAMARAGFSYGLATKALAAAEEEN